MPSAALPGALPLTLLADPIPSFNPGTPLKPNLELHVEIETVAGRRYRWDANDPNPGNRPQGVSFSTKLMEGHGPGRCALARNISQLFPDIGLYDTVRFIGEGASIAYEGRTLRAPRSNDSGDRVSIETAGWMTHARDRGRRFLGIDNDPARWKGPGATRRNALTTDSWSGPEDPTILTDQSGNGSVTTQLTGTWGQKMLSEAWYDAGDGLTIGALKYAWSRGFAINAADTNWEWRAYLATDDTGASADSTANLRAAGPGTGTLDATTDSRRMAMLQARHNAAAGLDGQISNIDWTRHTVLGTHGLPLVTINGVEGLRVSDLIAYTAEQYAPLLDTSELPDIDIVTDQAAWRDITDPYDMWLALNALALRNFAVWENRKLRWDEIDTTATADWIVRIGDGAKVSFEGPSVENTINGVQVTYPDIDTGQQRTLTPETHPGLASTDPSHPATLAGLEVHETVQLSRPASETTAVLIASKVLGELNRPRYPARIVVRGHVRDSAGKWQQGWRVHAGDTLRLEDYQDAGPRVVHETTWDGEARTLTVDLDADAKTIDALIAKAGG